MDDAILEYLIGDGHGAACIGPGTFRVDVREEDSPEAVGAEIARDLVEQRRAWQVLDPELAAMDDLVVNCESRVLQEESAVVLTVAKPLEQSAAAP